MRLYGPCLLLLACAVFILPGFDPLPTAHGGGTVLPFHDSIGSFRIHAGFNGGSFADGALSPFGR